MIELVWHPRQLTKMKAPELNWEADPFNKVAQDNIPDEVILRDNDPRRCLPDYPSAIG
ncbi:hypothetical protein CLV75_2278 [Ruegeria conchae]|uniref:Uncharacterized protein n=1 Tax=Ruegeria conchae TaxID=981384 RepID=A0A497ZF39_9RHOB|nr:hypothetical protein CLV75_2278 [Ruegeria conchae]